MTFFQKYPFSKVKSSIACSLRRFLYFVTRFPATEKAFPSPKASKMLDFYQFLSLASLALQVLRDCETNFKSRLARDARPLANPIQD